MNFSMVRRAAARRAMTTTTMMKTAKGATVLIKPRGPPQGSMGRNYDNYNYHKGREDLDRAHDHQELLPTSRTAAGGGVQFSHGYA